MNAPAARGSRRRLTVAMVPAGHPYARHVVHHPDSRADHHLRVLDDPHPDRPDEPADGRWWPPAMLDPGWVATHAFDVMHVHFGFEHLTPAQLADVVAAVHDAGRPLVYTLHDLCNPHLTDQARHRAQLDVLVPAADRVITLTAGAAAAVEARWGVAVVTLPHPHVVPLHRITRLRRDRRHGRSQGSGTIGVACKGLRANTDPARLLAPLGELVAAHPALWLVVHVHAEVLERRGDARAAALRQALERAAAGPRVTVTAHAPMSDDALWTYLAGLDVCVLPYTFGTHSGWLEACHDVGTSVVAPDMGHYRDQGADGLYRVQDGAVDAASLNRAVLTALRGRRRTLPGQSARARAAQRRHVVRAHERLYRGLALQESR